MRVSDMVPRRVEVIASEVTVRQAAETMSSLEVGALPVVDDDEALIGMISDRDIVTRAVARGLDCSRTTVGQVMTVDVVSLSMDAELSEAASLMQSRQVRRLPLVDDRGHTVGILALADLATRLDDPALATETLIAVSK